MSSQEVSAARFLDLLIRDLERALDHAKNARGVLRQESAMKETEDPGLPPTAAQIKYAQDLGIRLVHGMTRRELSRAISEKLRERRAG